MDLKTAIMIVEIIVAVAASVLLGDYLGNKIGRMNLAKYTLLTVLGLIILFAIYSAIKLTILGS
jgi:hypothetical protein